MGFRDDATVYVYRTRSVHPLGHGFIILEPEAARDLAAWQDLERKPSNKTCNQTVLYLTRTTEMSIQGRIQGRRGWDDHPAAFTEPE
jgi:hypothetical protein